MNQKLQKLQLGPQTLMSQLLEVAFGVFNNQDQAEEEQRSWHENRQARAQAMTTAVRNALQPQDNPSGPRKLNHHLEVYHDRNDFDQSKPKLKLTIVFDVL